MTQQLPNTRRSIEGFSLIELIIATAVTLGILTMASLLLSSGFKIRTREVAASDAAADVQRAINIMTREIANAGFNLSTNGIVPDDSTATSIRIRSNLNKYDATASAGSRAGVVDGGEDIKYFINNASNTDYLVRYDATNNTSTVLANRLDSLRIHYFAQRVTYGTTGCDISGPSSAEVTPANAGYIVIAVCVQLAEVGRANASGHQPARSVVLVSDVTLRNSNRSNY